MKNTIFLFRCFVVFSLAVAVFSFSSFRFLGVFNFIYLTFIFPLISLKCDQIQSKNFSWNNNNAQVDLVIDREDDVINLCEIKFYNQDFSIDQDYFNILRNKENQYRNATKTKKSIYTAMVTTWGVKANQYSKAIVANALTMYCLFESN